MNKLLTTVLFLFGIVSMLCSQVPSTLGVWSINNYDGQSFISTDVYNGSFHMKDKDGNLKANIRISASGEIFLKYQEMGHWEFFDRGNVKGRVNDRDDIKYLCAFHYRPMTKDFKMVNGNEKVIEALKKGGSVDFTLIGIEDKIMYRFTIANASYFDIAYKLLNTPQ